MSYDITLNDPVSGAVIEFDKPHQMKGGTYQVGGSRDAWLNITYNYSQYYYDASEDDPRFIGKLPDDRETDKPRNLGIRGIYGKTGAESITMLQDMIRRITEKYSKDGEWITTKREEIRCIDNKTGKVLEFMDRIGVDPKTYHEEKYIEKVFEGTNRDYWKDTAGNAIRPLFHLIAFAQMRPDGIWNGD